MQHNQQNNWNLLNLIINCGFILFLTLWFCIAIAEDSYSPYPDQTFPDNVYWGDTHLHTTLSSDGFISTVYGLNPENRLTPDDAYEFAKGKTVVATNGMPMKLRRPLDFLVIADHAEALGLVYGLASNDKLLINSEKGRRWHRKIKDLIENYSPIDAESKAWSLMPDDEYFKNTNDKHDLIFRKSIWEKVIENAERHNSPGIFTAFIGYEWTGMVFEGVGRGWWHRNVIYKDGFDKVSTVLPFTQLDSNKPEELWSYLSDYEENTGGEAIAIPHNPNLSGGKLFQTIDAYGQAFSREYALKRSFYEPLVEVTQTKGDSETHPLLSPDDEFSDFDNWTFFGGPDVDASDRKYDYVRSALKIGLQEQAKIGVNPFKVGLIGSTDSHTSLSNVEEDNFGGKLLDLEPSKERLLKAENWFKDYYKLKNTFSASGYMAVWANENTRESLFSAMKRKEVYASTGPRISVRFFGGWDFKSNDALRSDLARIGYLKGVPMGGDLFSAANDKAPSFLIRAIKASDGANLDRIQVVKGWHDKDGKLHERIYDVALSDGRQKDSKGKIPAVGSTVDIEDASYTNSIGDPELAVVWTDPDFNASELAFYYLRVLEIPTPRWTAYDAKFYQIKDLPDGISMVAQERAYSSPIWYTPQGEAAVPLVE